MYDMVLCWKRPTTVAGSRVSGLPYVFACRNVTMASSPASKAPSRTMALKPLLAVGGPQKSKRTIGDETRPDFSAAESALSARLVFSVTGPLEGY